MPSLLVTSNGKYSPEGRTALDALFTRLAAADEPKLLLHIHGGLVNDGSARAGAIRLEEQTGYGPLKDAGWETSYMVWRTGVFEALRNNIHELADDKLFKRLVQRLLKWVGERVLAEAAARGTITDGEIRAEMAVAGEPFSDWRVLPPEAVEERVGLVELAPSAIDELVADGDPLYRMLDEDPDLLAIGERIDRQVARQEDPLASRSMPDPEALRSWANLDEAVRETSLAERAVATDSSRGFGSILPAVLLRAARAGYRSVRRFVNERDHGLYCTVVEELSREIYGDRIGSGLWGLMQGDARDHFTADSAGTLLIDRLRALADEKEEIRLLVVGHSAGSILASHLVRAASELPDNVRIDLVFLAPAIRIDEAARTIAVAGARLANLRIFTMEDKNERIDDLDRSIAGKVYPRSLLYLISGILERREGGGAYADAPLLGMERHLRVLADARLEPEEREARATIARFLDAAPNRIIYSIAEGENGLCTGAKTHGTFDEDTPTLNSIRHIALFGY